jgi:RNA polymerase sigma-70 factor (ECF subfamily)
VPSSIHPDERGLVVRAQRGDIDAFAELYEWYAPFIFRYLVIRLNDRLAAEDLTSEVFLKAQESLQRYTLRAVPFAAWLFRIAHDRMVDHQRAAARHPTNRLDENVTMDEALGPEAEAASRLQARQLAEATASLTDEQRTVIYLRLTEGYNLDDTARIMQKRTGAIKALQHRALKSLAKKLQL